MPTYAQKRPVRVLDDDPRKYTNEHISHFFNVKCRSAFYNLPIEERNRLYEVFTDYEDVLCKVYGDAITKSTVLLSKLLKDGVDNEEVRIYKEWLDNR